MINVIHKTIRKRAIPRTGRPLDAMRLEGWRYGAAYQGSSGQGSGGTASPDPDDKYEQITSLAERITELENRLNALTG
ncbi:MAG: hypothetical protein LBS55_02195 [Prevotellaceae bacterium]|jgi:hypothetical protein|nr:hypothetical protein [Prevotellaceae bacterium]